MRCLRLVISKDLRATNGRDEVKRRAVRDRVERVVLVGLSLQRTRNSVESIAICDVVASC